MSFIAAFLAALSSQWSKRRKMSVSQPSCGRADRPVSLTTAGTGHIMRLRFQHCVTLFFQGKKFLTVVPRGIILVCLGP